MGKDVIIALDFPSAAETFRFLDLFQDEKPFVKIGMELFMRRDRRSYGRSRREDIRFSWISSFMIFRTR